mmetsp:Transcript_7679/g.10051  ORF Transcript_7679/g.10051 Transcript_7679/m.10051 type:complete len:162 (+) Transcript_7679:372-857(+)
MADFGSSWHAAMSGSGPSCTDTNCALLPLGFFLLAMDSYFDIRWVLWPSHKTAASLQDYYTTLLTPTAKPLPYPGFWFPVYVIFKLCAQCSTIYNFGLLALFIPISYKYVQVLNGKPGALKNWWVIIVLRIGLVIVNTYALRAHGSCNLEQVMRFWAGQAS